MSSSATPEMAKVLFASNIEDTGHVEKAPQYPAPKASLLKPQESSVDSVDVSDVSSVSSVSPLRHKLTNPPKPK